jgi:hypothetical protein
MTETQTIPAGYWQNANGDLIAEANIKDIDKLRDSLVKDLFAKARSNNTVLAEFKTLSLDEIGAFVSTSATKYDVAIGGKKGNVTLFSFDGRYKIQRSMQETISFDERLQAAKALIDQCTRRWSEGANPNLMAIVNGAFQVDKEGEVSTARVLGLRQLKIDDADWHQAMQAIGDSMKTVASKAYVRYYERNDATGKYDALALDMAGV